MKYSIMYYCQKRVIRILTIQRCKNRVRRIRNFFFICFEANLSGQGFKIFAQLLANIRFKIFVLKLIFANLQANSTFKRIFACKYSHTSEYQLANIRIKPFTNLRLVLGMEKTPVGAGTFCTLTHTGILHSSLPEISYMQSMEQDLLLAAYRKFCKSLKTKNDRKNWRRFTA